MMRRVPLVGCCVAFLGLLVPAWPADADPIVTGTYHVQGSFGGGNFTNGDITVAVGDLGTLSAASCVPCRAGTQLSFSGRFSDLDGVLEFRSPAFVLPAVGPGIWTVAMPFSFFGTSFQLTGGPLGSLGGSGIVTGNFVAQTLPESQGALFTFRHATFVAGEDSALVPEPASVLLLASGLGGLCASRRRPSKMK